LRLLPPALDEKRTGPGQTAQLVKKDGPVKTVADLKGKRVAVNTINSVNWMYDRAFLRKHGLDPANVTYVEMPFPSMIDTLMRGDVDAVNVPQPFHHIAMETGNARVLGYPFVEVQPGLHITAYAGSATWLDANPNTVQGFVRAMRRAVEYMRENPKEAKALIAEYTKSKPELVEQVPIDDWSTTLSADDVSATLTVMNREGLLKKTLDPKALIYELK
jgi:NitT/TauT family transport system substrate-binding protein